MLQGLSKIIMHQCPPTRRSSDLADQAHKNNKATENQLTTQKKQYIEKNPHIKNYTEEYQLVKHLLKT